MLGCKIVKRRLAVADQQADKSHDPESSLHRTQQGELPHRPHHHVHWGLPLGLAMASLGSLAAFMLRGCWHTHMSWPTRVEDEWSGGDEFSYQVCTGCGIKRLYDERTFHAYGPYGYDLHELIALERTARLRRLRRHEAALVRNARKPADNVQEMPLGKERR